MIPIIQARELVLLKQTNDLVLVDARAGADAITRYSERHLAGALFVDLDRQLADIKGDPSIGGRHPLPTPVMFARVLSGLGINPQSHVVVYDDKNGANAAARFWWMLKSIGHSRVQVLDGGMEAAFKAGYPGSSKEETAGISAPYENSGWLLPLAEIDEVAKAAQDDHFLLIDVRDAERFNGEKEPIDLIAGHIPGAVNIPFAGNLDTDGFFLSATELRDKYLKALKGRPPQQLIVHCGSGVTACHTLLAMDYAGIEIPKLYIGSWSEWSRNKRPMATARHLDNQSL